MKEDLSYSLAAVEENTIFTLHIGEAVNCETLLKYLKIEEVFKSDAVYLAELYAKLTVDERKSLKSEKAELKRSEALTHWEVDEEGVLHLALVEFDNDYHSVRVLTVRADLDFETIGSLEKETDKVLIDLLSLPLKSFNLSWDVSFE